MPAGDETVLVAAAGIPARQLSVRKVETWDHHDIDATTGYTTSEMDRALRASGTPPA
jgi:hypothetical protein